MKKLSILVLLLLCGFVFADLQLAKDGKTNYVISGAIKSQPARELKTYLEKMSGAKFQFCAENKIPAGKNVIYVGNSAFARKNGINYENYEPEAWSWHTFGKNLVIGGHGHYGNLHAVVDVLEKEFGCHWFSWDSEYVPTHKTLTLKTKSRKGRPDWQSRQLAHYSGSDMMDRKVVQRWIRAHRMNGGNLDKTIYNARFNYFLNCHNLYYLMPPEKYFKDHPEYYPMDAGGKRVHGNTKLRSFANLCFTNKDVARICAENLIEIIKRNRKELPKHEWPRLYTIDLLDACGNFLCLCPECKKLTAAENSDTALTLLLTNRIAEKIEKVFPEVVLCAAFGRDGKFPKTMRPRKNVTMKFALSFTQRDCFRPITHPLNAKMYAKYKEYMAFFPKAGMWDYWNLAGGRFMGIPRVDTCVDGLSQNLNIYYKNGMRWLFVENQSEYYNMAAFRELENWVGLQLMKDMSQDPEKLIATFMKGHYGPAEPEMTEYLTMLRKLVKEEKVAMVALNNLSRSYQNGKFFRKVYDLLHAALKKVPANSPYAIHIRREMTNPLLAIIYYDRKIKHDFDMKKIIPEYRKYAYEQIKLYGRKDKQKVLIKRIEDKLTKFTRQIDIPTPEQFKHIPKERLLKFGYDRLTYRDSNKYVKPDPDSAIGHSLCSPAPDALRQHGTKPWSGMWSTTFLINNWSLRYNTSRTVRIKDIPADEKFHWYRVGIFEFKPGRVDLMGWWWAMQLSLSDVYVPPEGGVNDYNIYEVWMSVKFTGPAYVKGSKKQNGIYMDQAILIRQEKK